MKFFRLIAFFSSALAFSAVAHAQRETVSFAAVGDIVLGLNYPEGAGLLPPEGGELIFESVRGVFVGADIVFGNLEGVLLDSGGTPKKCSNPKVCHVFRMPEGYVRHLVGAGFNLVSLANNHAGDFGDEGRRSTQKVLSDAGIGFAGLLGSAETRVLEKDGIRFGFAAFAPNRGTVVFHDLEGAGRLIKKLRGESDIVIVSMHIGAEGAAHAHLTRKKETYLGEDRGNPYEFARFAIDNGADLVFGHGPHVLRAIDLYKGKFIAYSLGNFATSAGINISDTHGLAPIIKIKTDRKGDFIEGEIVSAVQRGERGERRPFLDPTGLCVKEIKRLTEEDIPEAPLTIGADGRIRPK